MKIFIKYFLLIFVFYGCTTQPLQENVTSYKSDSSQVKGLLENNKSLNVLFEDNNVSKFEDNIEKIAIIYPSKSIGKYSIEVTSTAMLFLTSKNIQFELKVIDIGTETKQSIHNALNSLKDIGIQKAIFFVTKNNVSFINEYEHLETFKVYLPLVNKSNYNNIHKNIVFGGINYEKQFDRINNEYRNNLIEIYDDSIIGTTLHNQFKHKYPNTQSIKISGKNPNYEKILVKNSRILNDSTILLNMPIVKSSIVLSQFRANDINVTKVFSTQINYSPLLFVLTQKEDRKNFYLINAIEKVSSDVEELNLLFGNDILYNWVNFSTLLGVEYLITNSKKLFNKVEIIDNQVNFHLNIFRTDESRFIYYDSVK